MSATAAAVLKSIHGTEVPLRGVTASGRLTGLLFELTVEQTFENAGQKNIEAVYTFPVPHRAVLLGLELEIGERKLSAVAVRRQAASKRYEEAIVHRQCVQARLADNAMWLHAFACTLSKLDQDLRRGPEGMTGDPEALGELGLAQPGPGLDMAVQDLLAQSVRRGLDRGYGREGEVGSVIGLDVGRGCVGVSFDHVSHHSTI